MLTGSNEVALYVKGAMKYAQYVDSSRQVLSDKQFDSDHKVGYELPETAQARRGVLSEDTS
jgi:hypothetical protein